MKKKQIKFKFSILFFVLVLISSTIFAKSGSEHISDMAPVAELFVEDGEEQTIKDTLKWFSSHVIDDDTGPRYENSFRKKLNDIAVEKFGKSAIKIQHHRELFHWGFSDDIPFHSGELNDYLSQYDPKTRKEMEKMITNEWKDRVKKAVDKIEETFPELKQYRNIKTGRNNQALALAGSLYDIHQIGDLTTAEGQKLPKGTLRKLEKDLLKNLKRLYKDKDPQFVKDVEESFLKANGKPQKVINGLRKAANDAAKRAGENGGSFKQVVKVIDRVKKISTSNGVIRDISNTISDIGDQYKKLAKSNGVIKNISDSISDIGEQYNKLSEPAKSAVNSGLTTGVVSSVVHGYKWYNGEENTKEAIANVLEDSVISGASMYVSSAVVQKIGNKTVVTALIDGAKNHTVGELAGSAVLNHGVATFVSDGTRNVYHFMKGDISKEQFIKETAKSAGRSVVSGGCAAAAVCVANTVLGPHIVAMIPYGNQAFASIGSIAGGWIFDKVSSLFNKPKKKYDKQKKNYKEYNTEAPIIKDLVYEKVDERNFFFVEDVLGNLPLEMQKGITAFNSEDWQLTPSAFDDNFMNRPTAFNTEDWQLAPSAFDENYMNRPTAFNTEDWIIRNEQYENK